MKAFRLMWKCLAMAAIISTAAACSDSTGEDGGGGGGDDYDFKPILEAYADNVVIPTYADMKTKALVLYGKVLAFGDDPTQANLEAVCHAWYDVRAPWELSEAFLFGPCGDNGLNVDPNIDTWPFDTQAFAALIAGTEPLTVQAAVGYDETIRGYHTIEYLIFEDGHAKDLATKPLSAREVEYLTSASTVLYYDCVRVWAAWTGISALGTMDNMAVQGMKDAGYWDVEAKLAEWGTASYRNLFVNARSPYTSEADVMMEIVNAGMSNIAQEVAETKIESAAAGSGDKTLVESQYAHNSLTDFKNNILSIRNSYFGTLDGSVAEHSFANFVRSQDGGDDLDARIRAAITDSYDKIGSINEPFVNNLNDKVHINAAVGAVSTLDAALVEILNLL